VPPRSALRAGVLDGMIRAVALACCACGHAPHAPAQVIYPSLTACRLRSADRGAPWRRSPSSSNRRRQPLGALGARGSHAPGSLPRRSRPLAHRCLFLLLGASVCARTHARTHARTSTDRQARSEIGGTRTVRHSITRGGRQSGWRRVSSRKGVFLLCLLGGKRAGAGACRGLSLALSLAVVGVTSGLRWHMSTRTRTENAHTHTHTHTHQVVGSVPSDFPDPRFSASGAQYNENGAGWTTSGLSPSLSSPSPTPLVRTGNGCAA